MWSGWPQIGGFGLLVKFHCGGFATNVATLYSLNIFLIAIGMFPALS